MRSRSVSAWSRCKTLLARVSLTCRYKGIGPTLLSGAPYVGIQMTTFDMMKEVLLPVDPFGEDGVVSLPMKLLAGANAGLVAQTSAWR